MFVVIPQAFNVRRILLLSMPRMHTIFIRNHPATLHYYYHNRDRLHPMLAPFAMDFSRLTIMKKITPVLRQPLLFTILREKIFRMWCKQQTNKAMIFSCG